MEFDAFDVCPEMVGAVKVRCGLKAYIKAETGIFGTAIYSTNDLVVSGLMPAGK